MPGFGSWIRFDNARVVDGHLTVRSPWSPRAGLTARVRDSLVNEALDGQIAADDRAGAGRLSEGHRAPAARPDGSRCVRSPIRSTKIRLLDVAALRMQALPFRPPAAQLTAVTGRFRVQRRLAVVEGRSRRHAELEDARRRRVRDRERRHAAVRHRAARGVRRLPLAVPAHAEGRAAARAAMLIQWRGATQDYVMRSADVRTGGAHILGDFGVTMTDTIFFHDANLRFTGLTTKLIKEVAPEIKPPREGVLVGRAKFDGTPKRLDSRRRRHVRGVRPRHEPRDRRRRARHVGHAGRGERARSARADGAAADRHREAAVPHPADRRHADRNGDAERLGRSSARHDGTRHRASGRTEPLARGRPRRRAHDRPPDDGRGPASRGPSRWPSSPSSRPRCR